MRGAPEPMAGFTASDRNPDRKPLASMLDAPVLKPPPPWKAPEVDTRVIVEPVPPEKPTPE